MFKTICALSMIISGTLLYDQNGFVVIPEYAETVRHNPNYVRNFKVVSFKYNRTTIALNHTIWFKTDPGNSVKMEIQAYKFASNEYRTFPIRFSVNLCEAIARNDYGLNEIYSCGNMSRCPLKKGNYLFCNWKPNSKKYPPFIPEGRYMLDTKYFSGLDEIAFYRAYITIKNINKWDLPNK